MLKTHTQRYRPAVRTITKRIRFTEEEVKLIDDLAKAENLNFSEYARKKLLKPKTSSIFLIKKIKNHLFSSKS